MTTMEELIEQWEIEDNIKRAENDWQESMDEIREAQGYTEESIFICPGCGIDISGKRVHTNNDGTLACGHCRGA